MLGRLSRSCVPRDQGMLTSVTTPRVNESARHSSTNALIPRWEGFMKRFFIFAVMFSMMGASTLRAEDQQWVSCYFSQPIICPDGSSSQQVTTNQCYVQNGCSECGGSESPPYVTPCPQPQPRTCYQAKSKFCEDGSWITVSETLQCNVYRTCGECNASDYPPANASTCPEKQQRFCFTPQTVSCPDGSSITQYVSSTCWVFHSCRECWAEDYLPPPQYCPSQNR